MTWLRESIASLRVPSIRRRMLVSLMLGLVAVNVVAGYAIFRSARDEASELFDYELRVVASSLPSGVASTAVSVTNDAAMSSLREDHLRIETWDNAGRLTYQSRRDEPLPLLGPGLRTVEHDDEHFRVFGMQQPERFVQVAQPVDVRDKLALQLALRTLWPLWVILPIALLLVLVVVSDGLRPVRSLSRSLGARTAEMLEPLPVDASTPAELRPLTGALNDLLERLDFALQAQRTFIADAAHELRSPLAALKLHLQVAAREGRLRGEGDALPKLEQRLNRTIHLVQQLLTLAREDAGQREMVAVIDLRVLAQQVVGDLSLLAEQKRIDLGLELDGAPHTDYRVSGDAASLTVLINNLVDNAIRYSPNGGCIDVRLCRADSAVTITVADEGPGIPDDELPRVVDRFYRGEGAAGQGSGLGLAIVSRIAQRHGARLLLSNRTPKPGLCAQVAGLRAAVGTRA
jgi:two-component system OmpR family sensor kinase